MNSAQTTEHPTLAALNLHRNQDWNLNFPKTFLQAQLLLSGNFNLVYFVLFAFNNAQNMEKNREVLLKSWNPLGFN